MSTLVIIACDACGETVDGTGRLSKPAHWYSVWPPHDVRKFIDGVPDPIACSASCLVEVAQRILIEQTGARGVAEPTRPRYEPMRLATSNVVHAIPGDVQDPRALSRCSGVRRWKCIPADIDDKELIACKRCTSRVPEGEHFYRSAA